MADDTAPNLNPIPKLAQKVGEPVTEASLRRDLAAAFRLVAHHGWDDLVFTHISARIPGPEHHFLINPYQLMFAEVTPASLVKVGLDGLPVEPTPHLVNPAGFTVHSAVHMGCEAATCVMHLHTVAGVAVSCQSEGLLPLNQTAMLLNGNIAYHDYEGLALDHTERERLVADLGSRAALILRNHGTLTVGRTVAEAFSVMYFLERACQMQVAALAGQRPLTLPSDAVQKVLEQQGRNSVAAAANLLIWPALLRLLDRTQPGWREG